MPSVLMNFFFPPPKYGLTATVFLERTGMLWVCVYYVRLPETTVTADRQCSKSLSSNYMKRNSKNCKHGFGQHWKWKTQFQREQSKYMADETYQYLRMRCRTHASFRNRAFLLKHRYFTLATVISRGFIQLLIPFHCLESGIA